jgi:hypothetical protein
VSIGNGSFPLIAQVNNGTTRWKTSQNINLLRGSIIQPIQLDMSPPATGASSSTTSTCVTTSPSWLLKDINYSNSTSTLNGLGADAGGGLNMTIINLSANETVSCASVFNGNESSSGIQMFQCWRDPYASFQQPNGLGQLWTTVSLDERNMTASINQTWYCIEPSTQKVFVLPCFVHNQHYLLAVIFSLSTKASVERYYSMTC